MRGNRCFSIFMWSSFKREEPYLFKETSRIFLENCSQEDYFSQHSVAPTSYWYWDFSFHRNSSTSYYHHCSVIHVLANITYWSSYFKYTKLCEENVCLLTCFSILFKCISEEKEYVILSGNESEARLFSILWKD